MDKETTIDTLNELIETSRDGENGFRMCAENASSAELKVVFMECADRCSLGIRELEKMVRSLGGKPSMHGSASAAAHRGWTELKTALSSRDDVIVLNECERGEDVAKAKYSDALKEDLPAEVETTVRRQYAGVLQNHDQIRTLRDRYAARA